MSTELGTKGHLSWHIFISSTPWYPILDNQGRCNGFIEETLVTSHSKCSPAGPPGWPHQGAHWSRLFLWVTTSRSFPTKTFILPGTRRKRTAKRKRNVLMARRVLRDQHSVHDKRAANTHIYTFLWTREHLDQRGMPEMRTFPCFAKPSPHLSGCHSVRSSLLFWYWKVPKKDNGEEGKTE